MPTPAPWLSRSYSFFIRSAYKPHRILGFGIFLVGLLTVLISTCVHDNVRVLPRPQRLLHTQTTFSIPNISFLGKRELLELICKHTLFPETCLKELSSFNIPLTHAASPSHIVSLAVQAAANRASDAHALAVNCSFEQGIHHVEAQCAADCVDLMNSVLELLNAVVSKLSDLRVTDLTSIRKFLRDVKVDLSSSLSYHLACTEGFTIAPGNIQAQIQSNQEYLLEVIGNGFVLVDILAQVGNDLSKWLGALPPIPPIIGHLRRRTLFSNAHIAQRSYSDQNLNDMPYAKPTPELDDDDENAEFINGIDREEGFPMWVSAADRKLLQLAPMSAEIADATVAQDGSGDYLNITAALEGVPVGYQGRYVIYIKEGFYEEAFNVSKGLQNITFVGDGMGYSVITGDRNVASGLYNTYRTSTVGIAGSGFYARDITFQNTAGPAGHQAVALRAAADYLVFYRCAFEGYQDTLYALSSRQFYRECRISGTVDFIFGNAIAVFQNCEVVARLPMQGQQNTITAQGRKLDVDVSGFSLHNCTISGEEALRQNTNYSVSTYLGRPWKAYSRVVFLQSEMPALVDPAGWTPWNASDPFEDTLYYGEFQNRGPGSDISQRVRWPGVHSNLTLQEATQFSVQNFIDGETWLNSFDVQYQSTLS